MMVDPTSGIGTVLGTDAVPTTAKIDEVRVGFADWLAKEIESVNQKIVDSDTQIRKLAVGDATNLHQVMTSLTKAKMSFELVVQVRNKMLEAYQDIMRMQV